MSDQLDFLKELDTDYKTRPYGDTVIYYGLVGNEGIDIIKELGKGKEIDIYALDIRCRFNSHRNLRQFCCIIKRKHVPSLNIDSKKLYEELKEKSIQFTESGVSNESTRKY